MEKNAALYVVQGRFSLHRQNAQSIRKLRAELAMGKSKLSRLRRGAVMGGRFPKQTASHSRADLLRPLRSDAFGNLPPITACTFELNAASGFLSAKTTLPDFTRNPKRQHGAGILGTLARKGRSHPARTQYALDSQNACPMMAPSTQPGF